MVKFILPFLHKHQSMAFSKQRVPPTFNGSQGEFCLQLFWFSLHKAWDWASRRPAIFSWMRAESTPLDNNPPNTEDKGSPSWHMSYSSMQNRMFIWRFRVWHIQIYLERQVNTAYRKVWWTHMEQLWGLRSLDAQAVFRLVQVKASKRLGSDQLRERQQSWTCIKINKHWVQAWVGYNPPWT